MFTRVGFFEGKIRSGHEADFDRYVRETLLPIWRQTPHALRVEVMRESRRMTPHIVSRWFCRSPIRIARRWTKPSLRRFAHLAERRHEGCMSSLPGDFSRRLRSLGIKSKGRLDFGRPHRNNPVEDD
jgi:hypothetical protein